MATSPAEKAPAEKAPAAGHDVPVPALEAGGSGSAADAVKDMTSPGVARVEALAASLTLADRIAVFLGVFVIAYAYGLDGTLRYAYLPTVTASLNAHSLLATANVVRAVAAAAVQPTAAKVADVFGRVELICLAVLFYVLGTVVEAVAANVATFIGGNVLYQIGYTMLILLVEVVIADITSTRARLVFSYVPALPFLINAWVGGNVAAAVLGATTWRWGIAMWAIIMPVCALPLVVSLAVAGRRARRQGRLAGSMSARLGPRALCLRLFWLLDVIGILLLVAVLSLILLPLTIAGGFETTWRSAGIVAPIVIGVVCIPVFVLWELRAPHPLVPFGLMRDRGVWAPMGIAIFLNFAYAMQSDFLFTVLRVSFDFSITSATRISSLFSFASVIVGPILGLVVFFVRRLKVFVIAGTALYMVAFGLLIHFRGSPSGSSRAGIIGAQALLGIAGGLFPYTTQASLQVVLRHEHLAIMTGIFLAMYNIGSALGNTVSGAIWTQLLPSKLDAALAPVNQSLADLAYVDPFTNVVDQYPIGTPERTAVVDAYRDIQRLLTITGICLCVPLIGFSLLLRNPKLNKQQNVAKETREV